MRGRGPVSRGLGRTRKGLLSLPTFTPLINRRDCLRKNSCKETEEPDIDNPWISSSLPIGNLRLDNPRTTTRELDMES